MNTTHKTRRDLALRLVGDTADCGLYVDHVLTTKFRHRSSSDPNEPSSHRLRCLLRSQLPSRIFLCMKSKGLQSEQPHAVLEIIDDWMRDNDAELIWAPDLTNLSTPLTATEHG